MALDSLNMTLMAQDVMAGAINSYAIVPILNSSYKVETDPRAKTVSVNVFGEATGSEFDQNSASYTESTPSTSAVDVTMSTIYHVIKLNELRAKQTPVDMRNWYGVIGRAIAAKMFAKINALVTAANYTNTALTSIAANFDADDVADQATALSVAGASEAGRYSVFDPTYYGALSKDNAIQAAYAFGDDGVIKRNEIKNVHGFNLNKVTAVAASGDVANLKGWFAAPEAFAVGFAPYEPVGFAPSGAMFGSYTEPTTGLTIVTKAWDGNDGNIRLGGYVQFGCAKGIGTALTILKSA